LDPGNRLLCGTCRYSKVEDEEGPWYLPGLDPKDFFTALHASTLGFVAEAKKSAGFETMIRQYLEASSRRRSEWVRIEGGPEAQKIFERAVASIRAASTPAETSDHQGPSFRWVRIVRGSEDVMIEVRELDPGKWFVEFNLQFEGAP